jgi:hypothetical protein
MEMIRWKRLLIDTGRGQLRRLSLQLNANEIRHATGSRISWKATASEPWPIVHAAVSAAPYPFPELITRTSIFEDI